MKPAPRTNHTVCDRCRQICFEPYLVPIHNGTVLMCYQCLWDAIERSGGGIDAVIGKDPVIAFRTLSL